MLKMNRSLVHAGRGWILPDFGSPGRLRVGRDPGPDNVSWKLREHAVSSVNVELVGGSVRQSFVVLSVTGDEVAEGVHDEHDESQQLQNQAVVREASSIIDDPRQCWTTEVTQSKWWSEETRYHSLNLHRILIHWVGSFLSTSKTSDKNCCTSKS